MAMDEKYTARYAIITSGYSTSSSKDRGKGKMVALKLCECDGVQLLSKRLKVLEEEASNMRGKMVVCMYERREIVTEILQLFSSIHPTHHHSTGSDTKQLLPLSQERRYHNVGLLQVLCEDPSPGLAPVRRAPTVANEIARVHSSRYT